MLLMLIMKMKTDKCNLRFNFTTKLSAISPLFPLVLYDLFFHFLYPSISGPVSLKAPQLYTLQPVPLISDTSQIFNHALQNITMVTCQTQAGTWFRCYLATLACRAGLESQHGSRKNEMNLSGGCFWIYQVIHKDRKTDEGKERGEE